MATGRASEVGQRLRRAALLQDGAGLTDGQLLGCFLEQRDEAAFAALVKRHGPMVWGVCRRLLGHQDAEDAFQAAFLVVFRKAASIRPREQVANYLYGVARQTALQARRTAARRGRRERQVMEMPEPAAAPPDRGPDLQALLDQELSRLPDKYRLVIVLCDLEGRTRKEAARQLGWPEGTVAGRLARARALLAKRLVRQGVELSGGALAVALAQDAASAGVPPAVVASTIKAAGLLAAGQAAAGLISARAAALSEGVLKAMLVTKLKSVVLVVTALGMLTLGAATVPGWVMAGQGGGAGLPAAKPAESPTGDRDRTKGDKDKASIEKAIKREREATAFYLLDDELGMCIRALEAVARNPRAFTPSEREYWSRVTQFHISMLEGGLLPRLERGEKIEAYGTPFDAPKVRRLVERAKKLLDEVSRAEAPKKEHPKEGNTKERSPETRQGKPSDRAAGRQAEERHRMLRWKIAFDTKDGNEYAKELEALGARIAIATKEPNRYRLVCDLSKRPVQTTAEDISKINHIFWMDDGAKSVRLLAKELGLKETPEHIVVLLPRFVEDELLRKELDFAHRPEKDVLETTFRFVQTKRGFDIKVASQRAKQSAHE